MCSDIAVQRRCEGRLRQRDLQRGWSEALFWLRRGSIRQDLIPNGIDPVRLALKAQHAAFPLVTGLFVGLAGLEPAASSLSGIEGQALCRPPFS
jgi:hypothetical protein